MLSKILSVSKSLFLAAVVLGLLQLTGTMGAVSSTVQTAALGSGLWDASAAPERKGEDFDYNFNVKDLEGNVVSMNKFKGKVIFLNLWATWCGPCRAEMPTIQKLYDKVKKEEVVFVLLSVDFDQDIPKIKPFISSKAYTFPVYQQPMKDLSKQLQLPSIPATFVISKTGKILSKEVGMTNFNTKEFQELIDVEAAK